jgi:predicted TIM-barrel fold metal-dependent hydrolase
MTLRAIDIHVHPTDAKSQVDLFGDSASAFYGYFNQPVPDTTMEELARTYRDRNMGAVILALDAETATGRRGNTNDDVAEWVRRFPDTFAGFASVDPWKGQAAVRELERAITQLGLCGLKLHPIAQQFFPNEPRFYPLWEKASELGIPALFHTGQAAWGAGQPGGGGTKLKYSQPIPYLDDVAADFPELTVILAHPSFPWQDEALSMAVHKTNVYIDLSGWSPRYFPSNLVRYARSLLQDKCLFGSDCPALTPDRWMQDFASLDFPAEVQDKIYRRNAVAVLTHPNARPLVERAGG